MGRKVEECKSFDVFRKDRGDEDRIDECGRWEGRKEVAEVAGYQAIMFGRDVGWVESGVKRVAVK